MPAIVWAICIYIASSIPAGRIQWWLLHRFDKVIHLGIFFVFGLLVYRGLHQWSAPTQFSYKRVIFMLMVVLGYGLFDEMHQGSTPGRSVDFRDFLADVAGGILAGTVVTVMNYMQERRSRPR